MQTKRWSFILLCNFLILSSYAEGFRLTAFHPAINGFSQGEKPLIRSQKDASDNQGIYRMWGDIEYKGDPWVRNISRPNTITHGLYNRHIALWASHGRFYNAKTGAWEWQRPNLFGTNEDLFTQTIVVPYLIPMLQNAGAVVFTPRERDWQKNEIIVDNDGNTDASVYTETTAKDIWRSTNTRGFAQHTGAYANGENPFEAGTARMTKTTTKERNTSEIVYRPQIPEAGRYAVYVSYQTVAGSISDAQYTIFHKGQKTVFKVNQQMGGGTWVYLGTFDFDRGCNPYNQVVLSNKSSQHGVVTGDAVRFGGGMGNIQRGGDVSNLPRSLEGARYYAQWAGAPYSVYNTKGGEDDYGDDINARSNMVNWLAGGSVFVPSLEGKGVPLELSLAVHSDAGFAENGTSLVGSLAICTTDYNDGRLNTNISRMISRDFADALLSDVTRDIRQTYRDWARRDLLDRNYSETRNPEIPSAILETMSHQNFPDMLRGQDPNFRFTLARSIYKTILRFITTQHGQSYTVEPLAPTDFAIAFVGKNKIKLSWTAVQDSLEPTASPTSYNVYMATGTGGFNNGRRTKRPSLTLELKPGVHYRFKVTAVNRGGESFPTEVLSAVYRSNTAKTILVVNGFHRLSGPTVINTEFEQGFDLNRDAGVSEGLTAGWAGAQQCFDKSCMGIEGPGGLGFGGDEMAGRFVMGNIFDYVATHTEAIASVARYNVVSCSSRAIESSKVQIGTYPCVDLILGLEKFTPSALRFYKTFTPKMQKILRAYTQKHGRLMVSGAYLGSDQTNTNGERFLAEVLKVKFSGTNRLDTLPYIKGMEQEFEIYQALNDKHYAAIAPDILEPLTPAYCALRYQNEQSAGVAYDGSDYKCFTMAFPFECIRSPKVRNDIMRGILTYLLK